MGSFTGQHQDIAGGQYDFLTRELSANQGRWWTPDKQVALVVAHGAVRPLEL
ncbi:MAG TPA: hypothetical protein VIE13_09775 [Terriglobales bacterium]